MEYKTEDGVIVKDGEMVYNYYDMIPCRIIAGTCRLMPDPWFDTVGENGKITILNGQRICSISYAQKRGFPGANTSPF